MAPAVGLRERKKARTRASLREHALRLFGEQGYHATTVEQIAAAAEVLPSTFSATSRPKKISSCRTTWTPGWSRHSSGSQPGSGRSPRSVRPAGRFGSYTSADLDLIQQNMALTLSVPEVRARALDEFARTITVVGQALARRSGRPADDLAVRTISGAIIGVIMSTTLPWDGWADRQSIGDTFGRIDAALALLEAGLPL